MRVWVDFIDWDGGVRPAGEFASLGLARGYSTGHRTRRPKGEPICERCGEQATLVPPTGLEPAISGPATRSRWS
jgi:hypothetical protein